MGKYINKTTKHSSIGASYMDKIAAICADGGNILNTAPVAYKNNLVCVVDNGPFAAAAWCYNEQEFKNFTHPSDNRSKTWMWYPNVSQVAE